MAIEAKALRKTAGNSGYKQNKKISENEKALSFGIYGNTSLPHGLWVRRFSRLWERYARENGCGRAEERKMYEA